MFHACPCGGRITDKVCDRCGPTNTNKKRGTTAERGYDSQWNRFSANYRAKHPCCVCCEAMGIVNATRGRDGTRVDHIVPLELAPHRKTDPTNINVICATCDATYKIPIEKRYWPDGERIKREWLSLLESMKDKAAATL